MVAGAASAVEAGLAEDDENDAIVANREGSVKALYSRQWYNQPLTVELKVACNLRQRVPRAGSFDNREAASESTWPQWIVRPGPMMRTWEEPKASEARVMRARELKNCKGLEGVDALRASPTNSPRRITRQAG